MNENQDELNLGPQPLGDLLDAHKLANSQLVAASTEQLTHKMVNRGRKGRRLSRNVQTKILNALQAVVDTEESKEWTLTDLFNYKGKV